jgi:hypothetical protein
MVQHHGLWFWLRRIWQLLQVVGCITVMSIIYIFVLVFCFGRLLKLDISGFLFCELLRLSRIMQTSLKFCLSYLSTNCLSFYCSRIILYPNVFRYINLCFLQNQNSFGFATKLSTHNGNNIWLNISHSFVLNIHLGLGDWGVTNQFSLWNLRMYQLSFHSSNISK